MFGIFYLQSSYSILQSTIPISKLVENAKKKGYDFVSLSDTNLHAMVKFLKEAEKNEIKPVIGLKIEINIEIEKTGFLVYAKNDRGIKNLIFINNYIKTNIEELTLDILKNNSDGLIFISSGSDSIIDKSIIKNQFEEAYHYTEKFKSYFEFYIGISLQNSIEKNLISSNVIEIANKCEVKVLPINKTCYFDKNDKDTYEALIKIENAKNEVREDVDYSFKSKEELEELFKDFPYVFDNVEKLLSSFQFKFKKPIFSMPVFETPSKSSSYEYLLELSKVGLKKRIANKNIDEKEYQKRLLFELSVINKMEYNDYFLIVYDFVRYAKMNNILVGPGRGSAAGSLVSYCLGITEVDPIKYDLLFERFLNPDRKSMPDIDLDFPDNKRDEVINYVKEKYGINHIASITTFSTLARKSSIRDVARVMNIDITRVKGIINSIEKNIIDYSDEEVVRLLNTANKIEGLPRQTGTHAAGIILANEDLMKDIPLQKGAFDFYQAEFEAEDLEYLGLLKIDFLGIRNLAIIHDVLEVLNINLKIADMNLSDEKTYIMLSNADTTGIFQLESGGMRNVLKKLKPKNFEDIVAILALYRPGPMENIDIYISRKNGEKFSYIHKDLEPILKSTYGIIVYQEQVMRIASEFAGYTLAEADLLRRGMSKKDFNMLNSEKEKFVASCVKKGYDKKIGTDIYEYILKFANYGFNRSHSVAYALVAYQMAYLKANYYETFMIILLSSIVGSEMLVSNYIKEMKNNKVMVTKPNINISDGFKFTKKNGNIYFPLIGIKGLGSVIVKKIIAVRDELIFSDYDDFKKRLSNELSEKQIESLIFSGALDDFNINHKTMNENKNTNTIGYKEFLPDYKQNQSEEYTFLDLVEQEKSVLGFNISYNYLEIYNDIIKSRKLDYLSDIKTKNEISTLSIISSIKIITTKKGDKMAFINITDNEMTIEAVVFPKIYDEYREILDKGIRIITLRKNIDKAESYIVEKIETI